MDRETAETWIEQSEQPMLAAAGVAVVLYLAELAGLWSAWSVEGPMAAFALLIDVLFVLDLGAKIAVMRGNYLRSPWFVVDLVCTIPILSSLTLLPSFVQALRFVRAFRVLRALRMMRVLRTLRVLRMLNSTQTETRETRTWHRALPVLVVGYSVIFVALVMWARGPDLQGTVTAIDGVAVESVVNVQMTDEDGAVHTVQISADQLASQADRSELFLVVGSLVGIALMLVVMRFQMPSMWSRQMSALLNVAMPEQVARWLMENPDNYDKTVRMPATVIFCDIKGFTTTVETLELEALKDHLERAMTAIVDAHRGQDLIIDKFIGDAVMSFRGGHIVGGTPEDIAWRVVRGALDGMRALRELDDPHFKEVKVGGASSPNALIGAFGTSHRLSYTVLGDKVNLAARLEGACNGLGVSNLFCNDTHRLVLPRADIVWREVGLLTVQGRGAAETAWEAFDADDDVAWLAPFHAALDLVKRKEFTSAKRAFEQFLADHPEDGPALRYAAQCTRWAEGVDDDWLPILETRK